MEFEQEEPVSPTGLYMSSSALSLTTLGFLEFQVPIDDLQVFDLIKDLFLPINPRFSSIMVLFYSLFKLLNCKDSNNSDSVPYMFSNLVDRR